VALDSSGRCTLSDLFPDQCYCPEHRNIKPLDAINYNDIGIDRFIESRYDGRCALDASHPIAAGARIGHAYDLTNRHDIGWVCQKCIDTLQAL
jgi:hypothetical protein